MRKQNQHTCIYCKETKHSSEFNREHVINQAFGSFGTETMTLHNSVCTACNTLYFSKTIDAHLTKDSFYGLFRIYLFKKQDSLNYRRGRIEPRIYHPPFGYLLVDLDTTHGETLRYKIANQILIMNSETKEYVAYRPEQLPDKNELKNLGLSPIKGDVKFIFCDHPDLYVGAVEKANRILKEKNIDHFFDRIYESLQPNKTDILCFHSVIDLSVQRAIAKIAFNYFTKHYGCEMALKINFDDIRNFIRYEKLPFYKVIHIDNTPFIANLLDLEAEKKHYYHHEISIDQDIDGNIFSNILLFNQFKCRIILTINYPKKISPKKDLFKIT